MMLFVLLALDIYFLLTFSILWVKTADNKFVLFFSFFFPAGDNLHEISNPVF